jgi:futalosine hydrolase
LLLLLSPTRFEAAFLQGKGRAFLFREREGIRGEGWVWLESGIGKVNTALTLSTFGSEDFFDRVLLFGIAGAYEGWDLKIGDAALASEEIQADLGLREGLEAMGFPALTIGDQHYHNRFPLDPGFTWELGKTLGLPTKPFLTRDLVGETREEAKALSRQWGAALENMEGAAFAQTCLWLGYSGAELRAVSNLAGVRDKSEWQIGGAVEVLEHHITRLLDTGV